MAYDERLAERVRDLLGGHAGISERRMFGALCFIDGGPRPMRGWVLMHSAALATDEDLWGWVEPAVDLASSLPPKPYAR